MLAIRHRRISSSAWTTSPPTRGGEALAKSICRNCPARTACLSYALALNPDEGIWAGYTAEKLEGLNRRPASAPIKRLEMA
ncbi:WhiB family transcriptional regulator [Microtetraspora sp. NBRC 13810]|uniref:WhiB family transcriptional regulator n=1 Tax=Microtetraspora sp. NBRC 13810 TaxID=3030990 RepID=UPI00333434ED